MHSMWLLSQFVFLCEVVIHIWYAACIWDIILFKNIQVLVETLALIGILYSFVLLYTFKASDGGVTCTLGRTKVHQDLIQMVLIQLYCLTQYALQKLASFLVQTEFSLVISQKKTRARMLTKTSASVL